MKREFMVERQGRSFVLYAGLLDEAHAQGLKSIRTQLVQIPGPENGHVAVCTAEVVSDRGTFTGIGDASPDNVSRMMVPHILRMAETRAKARALRDAVNVGVAAIEELGEIEEADGGDARHPARAAEPHFDEAPRPRHAPQAPAPRPLGFGGPPPRPSAPTPAAGGPPNGHVNAMSSAPGNGAANGNARGANGANGAQPSAFGGGGVATADTRFATEQQVRAIYAIAKGQLGLTEVEIEEKSTALFGAQPAELTRKLASDLITALKAGEIAGKGG